MEANRPFVFPASSACGALFLLLCSCVGPAPIDMPARPVPSPAKVSPPPPLAQTDWHDMPATVGNWQWTGKGGGSIARFSAPDQAALFSLDCEQSTARITVTRAGQPGAGSILAIYTTSLSRTLAVRPSTQGSLAAILPAHDPLLDAIAFSRGRFAVEVPGLAPLYLPSWPEVARVIEDCRR